MRMSTDRILTTHVGSIPRPESLRTLLRARLAGETVDPAVLAASVDEAVREVVQEQAACGIDVVSDGEMSKTAFNSYAEDRLTGFEAVQAGDPRSPAAASGASWSRRIDTRREWRNFRAYYEEYLPRAMPPSAPVTICTGPIAYRGQAQVAADVARLRAAVTNAGADEAFIPAIAPSVVGRGQNQYYATEAEYRFAIAEALREEYRAIVEGGFILQIDDPGLGETWDMTMTDPDLDSYRKLQSMYIEALNRALEGIPPERVRYHLCWGSWQGPHEGDLQLKDVVDLLLKVHAQAYSIEGATPRHSWEWQVWKETTLPDDKVLIPGVIAHTTAVVEHPETIAERIVNYASIVGRERVIAGADCGFAQGSLYQRQHPTVMWAKFRALAKGAEIASRRLWP